MEVEPPTKAIELEKEYERVVKALSERLDAHDKTREETQSKLHRICVELRNRINLFEEKTNEEMEKVFTVEDNRLQAALNNLRECASSVEGLFQAIQKAKAELLVMRTYDIIKSSSCEEKKLDFTEICKLESKVRFVPEAVEMRKPTGVCVTEVRGGSVSVQFTHINSDEVRVLSEYGIKSPVEYKCLLFKKEHNDGEQNGEEWPLYKTDDCFVFTPKALDLGITYGIRVKMMLCGKESEWSDAGDRNAEFILKEFTEFCAWKDCPGYVENDRKYSIDERNHRIVKKTGGGGPLYKLCTVVGNTPIPLDKVSSWSIKVLDSRKNDGGWIYVGVAPFGINQSDDNHHKCGWYFHCLDSTIFSGPPHNCRSKDYGPRKIVGKYVHTGDVVGVAIDVKSGNLSFTINGVSLGVAFEGIPLDEPLVPSVLIWFEGDRVELLI